MIEDVDRMRLRGGRSRTASVAAVVLVWLAFGLAAPIVMSIYSSELAPDAVVASPRDTFTLARAVVLSDAPTVRIERGTLVFVDSSGRALSAAGASGGTPAASPYILLDQGVIQIAPPSSTAAGVPTIAAPVDDPAPLVEALTAQRFETLSLRRSTILLDPYGDGPEPITDVRADISIRRKGVTAIKGSGLMRGTRMEFDAVIGGPSIERKAGAPQRLPLRFTVKAAHLDASFDGRMIIGPELELAGKGELSASSGRQVARWLGAYWASGPGLREAYARGDIGVANRTLTFERAAVRLDGNEASGVLALRFARPRPTLSGTLAFRNFNATPYLEGQALEGHVKERLDGLSWAALTAWPLSPPLGLILDADLRVSADRTQLAGFELGKSAVTIALKDGRLLADLAEVRFDGSEGRGQLSADFTGYAPRVAVRGKLDNVDLGRLSMTLTGKSMVQAPATLSADLTGAGTTLQDIVKGLSGKFSARSTSGGRLAVDLKGLAAAAQTNEQSALAASVRGSTAFDVLDMRLVLRDGILLTETADVTTPDRVWAATGSVNLAAGRLSLRVLQAGAAAPGAAVGGGAVAGGAAAAAFEITGSLSEPVIRPLLDPGNANAATIEPRR